MKSLKIPKGVIRICISENRQRKGQKEKVQKDKHRSTKHTYKTKTRTPLKKTLKNTHIHIFQFSIPINIDM